MLTRQESLYSKALDSCNKKGYELVTKKEKIKDNKTYDTNNTVIQNTNKYFGQTLTNTFSKKVYFDKNSISDSPDFSNSIKLQNLEFDNFCNFYMGNTKTEILPAKKNIVFDLSLS